MMTGKTVDEMEIGDYAVMSKTVSESDVYLYAGITGDFNPAHIDAEYASQSIFKARIAHGMLTAGFISALLGTRLPGPGTIYVGQELKFLAPVMIGDTITARVEVAELNKEKNRVTLRTTCENQDKKMVLDGKAFMMPPRKK